MIFLSMSAPSLSAEVACSSLGDWNVGVGQSFHGGLGQYLIYADEDFGEVRLVSAA